MAADVIEEFKLSSGGAVCIDLANVAAVAADHIDPDLTHVYAHGVNRAIELEITFDQFVKRWKLAKQVSK